MTGKMAMTAFALVAFTLTGGHANWISPFSTGRQLLFGFEVPKVTHELPAKVYLAGNNTSGNRTDQHDTPHEEARRDNDLRRRCAVARGSWCGGYLRQEPVPTKPVPRGSKECPDNCSGWGNCNYDIGRCDCPAGRGGLACETEVKRPCTNRYRHPHESNVTESAGHIGLDKHDLNLTTPGWIASRCSGYCMDDLALCICGRDSKYRHIPAPAGSPPWTPPVQLGRPMTDGCMLGHEKDGSVIDWGRPHLKYDDIYGEKGWCNDLNSKTQCGCVWDGNAWPCDGSRPHEPFCVNQCTGHGDCHMGYCRCHPDWYGADCSRKKAGAELDPGHLDRPWLKDVVVVPPASLPVPATPVRPRPLIYVYDMHNYTSRFLHYRLGADACMWRRFNEANGSFILTMTYSIEPYLHEMLLQSEHRTYDPEEADFFYVPMYITCFMWPILGWADGPWWHAPYAHSRSMHVANMVLEAHEYISTQFPWWTRRGGRDHIWLMAMDEGACYMPSVVYNTSILLTHWGRTDLDHKSGTAYLQDKYDEPMAEVDKFAGWRGMDWQSKVRGHACYDPEKDLVIPAFKSPEHFRESPLLGAPPLVRDILLYFRGDIGAGRFEHYSRGIRQKLFHLAHNNDWASKHRIYIGNGETVRGSYSEHMSRSRFCLVAPGDGWSPRAEDAILHGCIPLVIMDGVHAVFESILEWESFSVRIRESALEAVPAILEAIPPERLAKMQRTLARVWHRFAYATGPVLRSQYERVATDTMRTTPASALKAADALTGRETAFRPVKDYPFADDAFGTIMQWLYHRINETRAL